MKAKTPTLKDIAQELGLSISTVSRALRGMPEINFETREAVLKLSKNLDYKLPSNQGGMTSTHSNLIAAIIPEDNFYFSQIVKGMDDAALDAGYSLIVCLTKESFGREVSIIQRLLKVGLDGFVIAKAFETASFEHYQQILKANKPLVMIDRECKDMDVPQLLIDNFQGGQMAAKHLIEKGYRKICFLGAKSYSYSKYTLENGFLESLKEARLDGYDKKIFFGEFDLETAYEKTKDILRMNDRPDAFFAANDQIAIGIYRSIEESGYNIPKDIGVLGYYDKPVLASFTPSISSIQVPAYELGKKAVNTIVGQIHGVNAIKTLSLETFPVELSQRESTNQTKRFFGI
jgi:DNA-binding LacI/PurR family transcriptional regulator